MHGKEATTGKEMAVVRGAVTAGSLATGATTALCTVGACLGGPVTATIWGIAVLTGGLVAAEDHDSSSKGKP